MLKSKYQVKEEIGPRHTKEVKEKRQSKNLSTVVTYKEDGIAEDIMSWLD